MIVTRRFPHHIQCLFHTVLFSHIVFMRFTLGKKISLSFLAIIATLTGFLFWYFPNVQERNLFSSYARETESVAETVALGVSIGFNNDDFAGTQRAIDYAKMIPGFEFVVIVNNGETIAAYPEDFVFNSTVETNTNFVVRKASVVAKPFSGTTQAVVGRNLLPVQDRTNDLRRTALWWALGFLAFGGLMGMIAGFFASRPVLSLQRIMYQVGEGDLNVKIPKIGNDEVGDLARIFDKMLSNIRSSQYHLAQANIELQQSNDIIFQEREKSEQLLLNMMPPAIAHRLKQGESVIADSYESVSILFIDLVGFTELSGRSSPEEVIVILNAVFSTFDEIAEACGLEKIKTIGDAYMVVAGLPEWKPDHAKRAATMALRVRDAILLLNQHLNTNLQVRIGVHIGSVVAGVIGTKKYAYDLWGDAVNIASRMESHGSPGRVHCSESVYQHLQKDFVFTDRGMMHIKGKGDMQTYFLESPV